jgi:MscS family membrane protein
MRAARGLSSFMKRILKLIPAFLLAVTLSASAQMKVPTLLAQQVEPSSSPSTRLYDPLGRETPRGTVLGFLRAVHADDYATASQFLQLSPGRQKAVAHQLARELGVIMDLKYQGRSVTLSDLPEGTLNDGFPLDRERIGRVPDEDSTIDVFLVRVDSPSGTPVWLFARDIIERVPELYAQVEVPAVARFMPAPLASHKFLSLSLGQWIGWLLAIPVSVVLAWLLLTLLRVPLWLYRRIKHKVGDYIWKERYNAPVLMLVSVVVNSFLTFFLGIPLPHRGYYIRALMVVFLIGVGWLAIRMIEASFERARYRAVAGGHLNTGSYLMLTQRIVRILAMVVVALLIFGALGFDTKTALAGLGIGGLAIALAAQKTLENLLGGVSLLVDNVVRVGDVCRLGTQVGTVTDLGLRSMSIRTTEQTMLSIPNGMLASQQFENLTGRTKFLIKSTLGLQYETSQQQLQQVLADIRALFAKHPRIEHDSARVRFVAFGQSSLDLELFCYVVTRDYADYLAVQEELLFSIMDIIGSNGTSLAYPVRRMIVEQGEGVDAATAARAIGNSGD